jgi:uncharacterized protein (TIGR03382 family)
MDNCFALCLTLGLVGLLLAWSQRRRKPTQLERRLTELKEDDRG